MIKSIGDNYRIYGLIIVKLVKKLLMLNYGFSNTTFEPFNYVFTCNTMFGVPKTNTYYGKY
jgi:hypothetical protein